MKNNFYCILMPFLLLTSCLGKDHAFFTNCCDHKDKGLNRLIRLDGYYVHNGGHTVTLMFFYADGTSVSRGMFANQNEAEQYFAAITPRQYRSLSWGRYRVVGNVIKNQSFILKEMFYEVIEEDWFEISGQTQIIHTKDICMKCAGMPGKDKNGITLRSPAAWKFVAFAYKPDSALSTINNKRWCQCERKVYKRLNDNDGK